MTRCITFLCRQQRSRLDDDLAELNRREGSLRQLWSWPDFSPATSSAECLILINRKGRRRASLTLSGLLTFNH